MCYLTYTQRCVAAAVQQGRSVMTNRAADRERGDVPGWVMITVMTAGLVVALGLIAGPLLNNLFINAMKSVVGP